MLNIAELTTQVRLLLAEPTAGFWTDATILGLVDRAVKEYQKNTLSAVGLLAINTTTYTPLPSNFLKIKCFKDTESYRILHYTTNSYDIENNEILSRSQDVQLEYYLTSDAKSGGTGAEFYTHTDDNTNFDAIAYKATSEALKMLGNIQLSNYYNNLFLQACKTDFAMYRKIYKGA